MKKLMQMRKAGVIFAPAFHVQHFDWIFYQFL